MTNQELLQELSVKVESGEITLGQVMEQLKTRKSSRFSLTKLLYLIGGLIATLGIIFFVGQIWEDLGSGGRIFITLILGLILAGIGSSLLKTKPETHLGSVFHGIAGFLIPGGALVTLYELGTYTGSVWPFVMVFGVIFLFYLLLNLYHQNVVLTLFGLGNGTAFIYLLVEAMVSGSASQHEVVYAYLTMVIGLSYLLLAYTFRTGWNRPLVGILNFLGSLAFFGAAFNRVIESELHVWEIVFFLLTIGGIYLAISLVRSRAVLLVSTLFLIAHFIYITFEYFGDSVSWPILLVILGFIFIALGYFSLSLNRKYLQ